VFQILNGKEECINFKFYKKISTQPILPHPNTAKIVAASPKAFLYPSQPMPVTVNRQAAALRSGPSLNTEQFGKKITNMFKFGVLKVIFLP